MIARRLRCPQPAMPTRSGGTTGAVKVRWTPGTWWNSESTCTAMVDRSGPSTWARTSQSPDDRDRAADPRLGGEAREHLAMEPGSMRR